MLLSLVVLAFCSVATLPARAGFTDCNNRAYIAQFDARLADEPGFLCVESGRTPVTSASGTTEIRIIQHLVSDWAMAPGALRAIKNGVAASAAAMPSLGDFEFSNVTILLVDGLGPTGGSENFGDVAAWTNFLPGDECRITLWLLGPGATADYGASVVAHELFHCVQRASLSTAQMRSGGAGAAIGGTWWLEGSADWFSTVAAPSQRFMRDRVRVFDTDSPRVALNRMAYEAYVFFAWLGGADGRESVVPFLRGMASSASEPAQRRAMAAALPADQWLRFAQDYRDQKVRDGHGADIGSTPQPGDPYTWDATRTQRIELPPFVLARADLTVRCGRWRFEGTPARFHAARPSDGTTWGPLPTALDAMDGAERTLRFVGMNTGTSAVALQVEGTREAACNQCAGTREMDRCLVGAWELTSHGAEQWMRDYGSPVKLTGLRRTNNVITLRDDGTFTTGASRIEAEAQGEDNIRATADLASQASGRWSAAGGRFNVCPDTRTQSGTVTVIVHGKPITVPMDTGPQQDSSQPYTCDGASLRMNMALGSGGHVENIYVKVPEPR